MLGHEQERNGQRGTHPRATARAARKKRANGVESRQWILDATVEIAGERGYEGTSIAAVIERSFETSLAAVELPGEQAGTPLERVTTMAANVAKSLVDAPDFLRLGLMLALERRPAEPRGRAVLLQARSIAEQKITEVAEELFPDLNEESVQTLTVCGVAGFDGLFVHREIHGVMVDRVATFEPHARLVYEAAAAMAGASERSGAGLGGGGWPTED